VFFEPVKETRKVRPGIDKERREVVGFQASRGVLLGFEIEMARLQVRSSVQTMGV